MEKDDEERRYCAAMTRAGSRCRRRAVAGSPFCRQHEHASTNAGIFASLFTDEEVQALKSLENQPSVDDVMPVLLVSIRRALEAGASPTVVVRACEAYVRALRERRRLAGTAGDAASAALEQALDALSHELDAHL